MAVSEGSGSGRVRVGLIGCGKMGMHHLRSIRATGLAEVVGIADPLVDPEIVQRATGVSTRVFGDADTMLETARPDAVHIVTPPATHASLACRALECGSHVYVEKPFTPTLEEARRVVDLAAEKGLQVCAGHQVLFERPSLALQDLLSQIHRLTHLQSYFAFRQVRQNLTPTQQVQDILPHAVYPLLHFLQTGTDGDRDEVRLESAVVHPRGEVFAIVRSGDRTGTLVVTLVGRPVAQTLDLVGTNGWLHADFVSEATLRLPGPGASAPAAILAPYRLSLQTVFGATRGFAGRFRHRAIAYPGLPVLAERFYRSILDGKPSPVSPRSILDTVRLCEEIEKRLLTAERDDEDRAREILEAASAELSPTAPGKGRVVVTGGTGLLGRAVCVELRKAGWPVRAVSRRVPPFSKRLPGVEYVACDLGDDVPAELFSGAEAIIHCAAETAGGMKEHERNSVAATRHVLQAAKIAQAGKVVHVSSIAILESSSKHGAVDESTPVVADPAGRGPYVWGKAESERQALEFARDTGLPLRVVRPGPLVDYEDFHPPGRLGREVGPWFVRVGRRGSRLSVCDVHTASKVLRSYVEEYEESPPVLNLVEPEVPTRGGLLDRYRENRPDLGVMVIPLSMLRLGSPFFWLAQRVLLGSKKPLNVYAAFAAERHRTDLAGAVVQRADATALHDR